MEAAPAVRMARNDARGSFSKKATRSGLSASTAFTLPKKKFANGYLPSLWAGCSGLICRSMENFTASAVSGVPSWNLIPPRSLKVYCNPSFEMVHDSASPGTICVLWSGKVTSVSTTRRPTRFELRSVTCAGSRLTGSATRPTTSVPAGCAAAGPATASINARIRSAISASWASVGRRDSKATRPPAHGCAGGLADETGAPRQEQADLRPDDEDHEADQQRGEIRPVRLEVLSHRDVAEAQGHEQTDPDGRQEEPDADGGREHDVEVDRMDADLLGNGKHHRHEHHRRRQALQHHAEEDDDHGDREQEERRRALEREQDLAEECRHAQHAHQELVDAGHRQQEHHRRRQQRAVVDELHHLARADV